MENIKFISASTGLPGSRQFLGKPLSCLGELIYHQHFYIFWYILRDMLCFLCWVSCYPARSCPQHPLPPTAATSHVRTRASSAPACVSMWFMACQGFTHISWVLHQNQAKKIEARSLHPFFNHCISIRKGESTFIPLADTAGWSFPAMLFAALHTLWKKFRGGYLFCSAKFRCFSCWTQGLWPRLFFPVLSIEQNEKCSS